MNVATIISVVRDVAIILVVLLASSILPVLLSHETRLTRAETRLQSLPPSEIIQSIEDYNLRLRRLEVKIFNVPNLGVTVPDSSGSDAKAEHGLP